MRGLTSERGSPWVWEKRGNPDERTPPGHAGRKVNVVKDTSWAWWEELNMVKRHLLGMVGGGGIPLYIPTMEYWWPYYPRVYTLL